MINDVQPFPRMPLGDQAFLSPSRGVDPVMAQRLTQQQRSQSLARKFGPIIHGVATLSLFVYLAFIFEPRLYNSYEHIGLRDFWSRWSQLSVSRGSAHGQSETVNRVVSDHTGFNVVNSLSHKPLFLYMGLLQLLIHSFNLLMWPVSTLTLKVVLSWMTRMNSS